MRKSCSKRHERRLAQIAADKAKFEAELAPIKPAEDAIDNHDLDGLRKYIAAGGNVNATDSCGSTLLARAANRGNIDAGQLLLQHGAQVDSYALGCAPLHCAINRRNIPFINLLLDHKANIEAQESAYFSRSPLMIAVIDACYNDCDDKKMLESEKVISLLCRRGALVNRRDEIFGRYTTPFLEAISAHDTYYTNMYSGITKRSAIIKLLIRWGADLSVERMTEANKHLDKRQEYAKSHSYSEEEDAIYELWAYIANFTSLEQNETTAACLSHLNSDASAKVRSEMDIAMKEFILGPLTDDAKIKADLHQSINRQDVDNLKDAIQASQKKEVHLDQENFKISHILYCGKPQAIELRDEVGYTPLLYAVHQGKIESVKSLLELGASLDAKTNGKYGKNAFQLADMQFKATGNEVYRTIKTMLDDCKLAREKAELEKIKAEQGRLKKEEADAFGQSTQLHQAIIDNHSHALRDCLNPRTVNKRYIHGSTPLLQAAALGRVAIAKQLLNLGAYTSATDANYNTPLDLAVIHAHVEMAELLLKHMSPSEIRAAMIGDKSTYARTQEIIARNEKRLQEDPSNEIAKQNRQKYEQILMILDSYNGVAANFVAKQSNETLAPAAGSAGALKK